MTPIPRPRTLLDVAVWGVAAGTGDTPTRRRVFTLVQEYPGLHQREIARRLGVRASHAEYHLRQLEKAGLVSATPDEGYVRYFVTTPAREGERNAGAIGRDEKRWLTVLRQARPLQIVALLIQEDPLRMGTLSERAAIAAGTLTYQVKKLEKAGIVTRYREGNQRYVALVDRARLVDVLLAHEPPDDLVSGFEDLWDDIGL